VRNRRPIAGIVLSLSLLTLVAPGVAAPAAAGGPARGSTIAGVPTVSAWVVVRRPSATQYTPEPRDRGNSAGGVNKVRRHAVGSWTIRMPGLDAAGGDVQVSSLSSVRRFCGVREWYGNDPLKVDVTCYRPNGVAVDSPFVVTYTQLFPTTATRGDPVPRLGYLWNNNSVGNHTPDAEYQASSNAETWTMAHLGTGTYAAHLPSVPDSRGMVQVTPYSAGTTTCIIDQWAVFTFSTHGPPPELIIRYRCRDAAGALVDARSTLLYLFRLGTEGYTGGPAAYLWAGRPGDPSYHPASGRRYNSSGDPITIERTSEGAYRVTIGGQPSGGAAIVTAYGDGPIHCQPSSIRTSGSPLRIGVRCFATDGSPTDARFTLAWTK
jgi:hypothetical protein